MKRRGVTDGGLPEQLVRYREGDWVGPNVLDPYPHGVDDPPAVRWSRARRSWARHARTLAELTRSTRRPGHAAGNRPAGRAGGDGGVDAGAASHAPVGW